MLINWIILLKTGYYTIICELKVKKTESTFKEMLINWSILFKSGYYTIICTCGQEKRSQFLRKAI